MKRTYQPKTRRRSRVHGFRARMKTTGGAGSSLRGEPVVASDSPSSKHAVMHAARLRRGEDIARVRAEGVARNDTLFSLRALPTDGPTVRLAVAASRSVGGAVERNRARRRVREAVRLALATRPDASCGIDLVVMVRKGALDAPAELVRGAVERQLDAVFA